jgi:hypothetical protein
VVQVARISKDLIFINYFIFIFVAEIWLNLLMDDHHFGYIRKLKKEEALEHMKTTSMR